MKKSAGILLKCKDRVLLAHSTSSAWWGTWMPPKGGVEGKESNKDAAIRETLEEVGIQVDKSLLDVKFTVPYVDKKGKTYKEVIIYVVEVADEELFTPGLVTQIGDLQYEEVDSIKWMDAREVEKRAFWRFKEQILNYIK